MDPEASAALMGREEQGRHQECTRQQEQQVAVALEVPGVAHDQQRQNVEPDADARPNPAWPFGLARGPSGR